MWITRVLSFDQRMFYPRSSLENRLLIYPTIIDKITTEDIVPVRQRSARTSLCHPD
jgi:hypothetical protein